MSTSTSKSKSAVEIALAKIDKAFRKKLIDAYLELKRRANEDQTDAAGLSAGKFCEILIRFLQKTISGKFTPFGTPIRNMADECRKLIESPTTSAVESLRVIIPRALSFLYTLRNKRGIGHVGGDVDANKIDLSTIVQTADWIICELIRVFHGLSLEEAQDIVDGLSIKAIPYVWSVAGKKRVLVPGLNYKEKVLLLLYGETESAVLTEDLNDWVEYSNFTTFKSNVLRPLHTEKHIEYDRDSESIYLSPKGARHVEIEIFPKIKQT